MLFERILSAEATIVRLDDCAAIAAVYPDDLALLILSPRGDWWAGLPDAIGLGAAVASLPATAFAMVPRGDSAALALAFDSGIADCASYPIDPDEVRIRVRALLRRKAAADQLRADAAEVRRIAHTDPVTGLWNRHYLDSELAATIAYAAAAARPLSLLMIDIDRFKPINDKHGHAIGDKVLRAVATRLSGGIRAIDTLARFGGDELVLVMPDTGIDVALNVAERLRSLVAEGTTEVPFRVTISIGVAELDREQPATALLAKADAALYTAKIGGRNRVAEAS